MEESIGKNVARWMTNEGPHNDIVWSSRIRLARNISQFKFPSLLTPEEEIQLIKHIVDKIDTINHKLGSSLKITSLEQLTGIERLTLVEKHLISPAFANKTTNGLLLTSKDDQISIMVNEEDHIRIQSLFTGLQLEKAHRIADYVDDCLEEELNFSYHRKLGYLTSCPTNTGTALRASAMLHVPALVLTKQLPILLETIQRFGVVVRGIYGEGSESVGQLFQISNQITLGRTEQETIDLINTVIEQLIEQERSSREKMWKRDRYELEDRIFRSLGILQYSRKISIKEALQCMTYLQIGNYLNIKTILPQEQLNALMISVQSGHLQLKAGKMLSAEEQEIQRAELIRTAFENKE